MRYGHYGSYHIPFEWHRTISPLFTNPRLFPIAYPPQTRLLSLFSPPPGSRAPENWDGPIILSGELIYLVCRLLSASTVETLCCEFAFRREQRAQVHECVPCTRHHTSLALCVNRATSYRSPLSSSSQILCHFPSPLPVLLFEQPSTLGHKWVCDDIRTRRSLECGATVSTIKWAPSFKLQNWLSSL